MRLSTELFLVMLILANFVWYTTFGTMERSWSENLVVVAGRSELLTGGLPGESASSIQVFGTLAIASCCGYSTNDIKFSINHGDSSLSQYYGQVSESFRFEWDTVVDYQYFLVFDNRFDVSSLSYHNKTVEVTIREVIQTRLGILLPFAYMFLGGIVIAVLVAILIVQRRRVGTL